MNIPLINTIAKQRLQQQHQKEALQRQILRSRLSDITHLSPIAANNAGKKLQTASVE